MPQYSVADAKNGLPGLIDKALAGEEVVITRHGKPVVELRPALPTSSTTQADLTYGASGVQFTPLFRTPICASLQPSSAASS